MTPSWTRRLVVLTLVALGFLGGVLVGHSGPDSVGDAVAAPESTSVDAGFARDMTTHHEQAVQMALLIRERGSDPRVRSLARDIALTQQHQIGQMHEWLASWGLPYTTDESMAWMPGHSPDDTTMPGMASPQQLHALTGARGRAADIRFLRLMIEHHHGGIMMADAAAEHATQPHVRDVAIQMASQQRAENKTMRALLRQLTRS